jgi:hypothetical protein
MCMSHLIIHHGNKIARQWALDFFNRKSNTQLAIFDDLSVPTDITPSTQYSNLLLEIFKIKKCLTVTKVVTSFEHDQMHLDSQWRTGLDNFVESFNNIKDVNWPNISSFDDWHQLPNCIKTECVETFDIHPDKFSYSNSQYDYRQWLQCLFYGLTISDQVIFWENIEFSNGIDQKPIIFTPGRSGTNVLKDIVKVDEYLHHDHLANDFDRLVNAKQIYSVLRYNFIDQVCSDAISNQYDIMLTTEQNIKKNQIAVSKWKPIMISASDIVASFEKILSYTDILIGLNFFFNKKIYFSILENLSHHFDNINHKKNPYTHSQIVSNYDYVKELCETEYQHLYETILTKVQQKFGTTVYL